MATTHVVKPGDTLWGLAQKYLGDGSKYMLLATWNKIPNPDLIIDGQTLIVSDPGGGGSTDEKKESSNKPDINQFGVLSTDSGTLLATWTWGKESETAKYKVLWTYDTGDGVWLGSTSEITVDEDARSLARQSTYSIPSGAKRVKFKVKPISETKTQNNKEVNLWTAEWSNEKTWTNETPIDEPNVPSVEIDKYKLTASLDNVNVDADGIEFEVVKDNNAKVYKTGKSKIVTSHASYSWTVDAGGEYKVRCRAYKGSNVSEWTDYSNPTITIPAASTGITSIKAKSKTSVYLEWAEAKTATSYEIEYATKKEYFDGSDQTTSKTGIETTHFEVSGLEIGNEYFFRVRATNEKGSSAWTDPKSVVIGSDPEAPTTWSSTTTVITGEPLTLYWIHNAEDGSTQTYADLELYIGDVKKTYTIDNSERPEDDRDTTSSFEIDTSEYLEGTKILWRVRTAGITNTYGDWSVQRTVDVYAPPTLELSMNSDSDEAGILKGFPFTISAVAGPNTQSPISYHLSIVSCETYETTDNMGNPKIVSAGESVYSQHFDTFEALSVTLTPNNIDLENNVEYEVGCVVSMNSGLTGRDTIRFKVSWTDVSYEPNAEIGIDRETWTASIRPYCDNRRTAYRKVNYQYGKYTVTEEDLGYVYGEAVKRAKTTTGEQVYKGMSSDGAEVYFCTVMETTPVEDVYLSVYRREFDGSFTELASGLDGAKYTTVTDPHPALDFARYRIVAASKTTGAISYYDPPGYPIGCTSVIIQWDEAWSTFETTEDAALVQPPWSGSLLELRYNVDITENTQPEVETIKYIGRSHPVTYYGTQVGQSGTWAVSIEKDDLETIYALRRLSTWMGDAYVRAPSGVGYWAHVVVSFNKKHGDMTIPVTLNVTRVEGGA